MKVKDIVRCILKEADLVITEANLLTVDEAKQLPERLIKYNLYWWLRSPSYGPNYAATVGNISPVYNTDALVDIINNAVRPALEISNLKSSNLKIGDTFEFGCRRFEIISDNRAFCLEDIGESHFNHYIEGELDDFNDYEESDIKKKIVDEWFDWSVKLC